MITLIYQNGTALIYKIQDWELLREQYRIVGNFFGTTQFVPVLPLALLPEETYLLVKKRIAQLVDYPDLTKQPTDDLTKLQSELLTEEKNIYKEIQRKRLENYIEKIIEGKKRSGDLRSRNEIYEEELNRNNEISVDALVWPIFTEQFRNNESSHKEVSLLEIEHRMNLTNYKVYEDLWERGYYVTKGQKFGGDYLVYKGDPLMYHAVYIVQCLSNENEQLYSSELVTLGRVGSAVKKRALIATVIEDEVQYITLNWMDS